MNSCHGKHRACPQPQLHSCLLQLIFLETFFRGFFFFHLQRSLSSLDHPDRPLLHSSFPCSPRLPFSFLTAGQRGKQARNRWHRGSGGKSTPPGSWVKVRKRTATRLGRQGPASGGTWEVLGDGAGQLPRMEVSHFRQKNMRDFKSCKSITGQGWEPQWP